MPGRKKKPLAQDIAEGNPGHKTKAQLNLDQPTPELELLKPPNYLSARGKKFFKQYAKTLYENGLLTSLDSTTLETLSELYGQWIEVRLKLRKEKITVKGSRGQMVENPLIALSIKLADQINKIAGDFGMSPVARTRIKLAAPVSGSKTKNAMERLEEQRAKIRGKYKVSNGGAA